MSGNPSALATSVYPVPTLSIDRLENVATPFTAPTDTVPDSVPAPGLVPIASVTVPFTEVTVFPEASWKATFTAGAMGLPAEVFTGGTVNAIFAAEPDVPVAVNGTGGTPENTALRWFAPCPGPSVQLVWAIPVGLVVTFTGLTVPLPGVTSQLIALPPTPLPLSSTRRTVSESVSVAPACALCPSPEMRSSAVGLAGWAV